MSNPRITDPITTASDDATPLTWRDRWRRRRLATDERHAAAEAAERDRLQALLSDARRFVETSWVQGAWFSVRDETGRTRLVRGGNAVQLADQRIVGSCLVGAIIRAGGGVSAAQEPPVQRALDAVWHALREQEGAAVQWSPPPMTRMQHVRDLTRWNDRTTTTSTDVSSLLLTAERVVLSSAE